MRELIANNAKFIIDYGQFFLGALMIGLGYIIYRIGKPHRYFLPRTFIGWLGSLLSVFLLLLSTLMIAGLQQEKSTTGKVLSTFEDLLQHEAPPLAFQQVSDGSSQQLEDYRGKVVILNLWATWCGPCLQEFPDLNELHKDYQDEGLVVITLSDEDQERLIKFQDRTDYDFVSVYNQQISWIDQQIGTARPLTFVIDREGIISEYVTGTRDYEYYQTRVKALL